MKRIQSYAGALLLASCLFTACSSDDAPESLQLDKGTQTQQTVYADDTSKAEGIKFVAAAPWKAVVRDLTRASEVDWLELSAYEGGAGEYTLGMTLKPNLTGQDRTAEIVITCAESVLRIRVEQKGVKQDGQKPDDQQLQPKFGISQLIKKQYSYIEEPNKPTLKVLHVEIAEITYDQQGRFIRMEKYKDVNTNYMIDDVERIPAYLLQKTEVTYQSNTKVKAKETDYLQGNVTRFHTWDLQLNDAGHVIRSVSETNNDGFIENYALTYQDGYIASSRATEPGDPTAFVETPVWDKDNLVKVSAGRGNSVFGSSEMFYGSELNPNTSADINFLIAQAEFHEALGEDSNCLKAFGFYGKRSKNLLVKEINKNKEMPGQQEVFQYTYHKNQAGLIESIDVKSQSFYDNEEYTWILKYQE